MGTCRLEGLAYRKGSRIRGGSHFSSYHVTVSEICSILFRLTFSRVAQRKRAGPITQRSVDRNHPLLRKTFSKKTANIDPKLSKRARNQPGGTLRCWKTGLKWAESLLNRSNFLYLRSVSNTEPRASKARILPLDQLDVSVQSS